jgi:hypothetical protein
MFTVQDASTIFTLTGAAADKVKNLIEVEGNGVGAPCRRSTWRMPGLS